MQALLSLLAPSPAAAPPAPAPFLPSQSLTALQGLHFVAIPPVVSPAPPAGLQTNDLLSRTQHTNRTNAGPSHTCCHELQHVLRVQPAGPVVCQMLGRALIPEQSGCLARRQFCRAGHVSTMQSICRNCRAHLLQHKTLPGRWMFGAILQGPTCGPPRQQRCLLQAVAVSAGLSVQNDAFFPQTTRPVSPGYQVGCVACGCGMVLHCVIWRQIRWCRSGSPGEQLLL